MSKRSPEAPLPTGEPPAKVFKPEVPVSDSSKHPNHIPRAHQDSNACPSQDMPPPPQREAGRAAGGKSPRKAPNATDEGMTPESGIQAGISETDLKRYDLYDPKYTTTDAARRDRADINLYRKHFSGYRDDKAHLSSNPYIESDARLAGGEHYHDFPGEKQGGTHTRERRADPSLAYPMPATAQGGAPTQDDSRSQDMSDYRRREPGPMTYHEGERDGRTKGDKEGRWTERVRSLRDYAEARGASLRSMSPERRPPTFHDDTPGPKRRNKSVDENEMHGREATMALYSYPQLGSGRQFFSRVPEGRREELEKVRRDLKDMEEQLQIATKERINEVSSTLDTGPSSARSPPPKRD